MSVLRNGKNCSNLRAAGLSGLCFPHLLGVARRVTAASACPHPLGYLESSAKLFCPAQFILPGWWSKSWSGHVLADLLTANLYSDEHTNFMICLCFWQIYNSVFCSFLGTVFKGKISLPKGCWRSFFFNYSPKGSLESILTVCYS